MDKSDIDFSYENIPVVNNLGIDYVPKTQVDRLYKLAMFIINKKEVEIDKLNLCLNSYEDTIARQEKHLLHHEIMTKVETNREEE